MLKSGCSLLYRDYMYKVHVGPAGFGFWGWRVRRGKRAVGAYAKADVQVVWRRRAAGTLTLPS